MRVTPSDITPPMPDARAQQIAQDFDLRSLPADFLANPYPVYSVLREQQPMRRMPDGSWLLTRHADLVAVYRDAASFSSDKHIEFAPRFNLPPHGSAEAPAPLYQHHTTSLVFSDPPLHTRVRRLLMGALTRRAIAEMETGLVQLVDRLLDSLAGRGAGDLIEDYAAAIPVEVIGNLLGVPLAERGPLRAWSLAILGALEPSLSHDQHALGNRSVLEMLDYLRNLVERRRRQPGDPEHDVLTRLIRGDGPDEQLSELELLHNCIFLLNAGHETTTNLIGNALVLLQEHPAALDSLLRGLHGTSHQPEAQETLLTRAVDEVLRMESSNQLGNRRALRPVRVGGVDLPEGSLVTLCIGAANRDPAVFSQPGVPDLERDPNRHLAFGLGIHQCAGLHLARLEGRIALGRFLARFPGYRLSAPPVRGGRARFRGFLSAPVLL
jgi:cytochrome P450